MRGRRLELLAAAFLALSAIVIAVAPTVVGDPNALAMPAAVVAAIGAVAALLGGVGGRRAAIVVAVAGVVLDALWLWLASYGFGKGVPWVDDMIEAAILVGTFLAALVCLVLARRRPERVAPPSAVS